MGESSFRSEAPASPPPSPPKGARERGRAAGAAARGGRGGDKRERILRAAVKVFAKKGFYRARVSEIAKAAGVADGTIYLYFRNKDDVLVSLFEDRCRQLIETLRSELAERTGFEERVRRIVEVQLGLLEGQRDLAEVVTVNLRQSTRLLKQFAAPLFGQYLETIAEVIAQGQREGHCRTDISPRLMARALWGALDGIALTWALGNAEPGGLKKAARQLSSVILDGTKTHGPPAAASSDEPG